MLKLAVAAIITGILFGCGAGKATLMESKLDAPLRLKLSELQTKKITETLAIFGKCTRDIDAQMRKELTDAGAKVETVTGDIFTARVSSGAIAGPSSIDFVTQLQLSQTSNPLPK